MIRLDHCHSKRPWFLIELMWRGHESIIHCRRIYPHDATPSPCVHLTWLYVRLWLFSTCSHHPRVRTEDARELAQHYEFARWTQKLPQSQPPMISRICVFWWYELVRFYCHVNDCVSLWIRWPYNVIMLLLVLERVCFCPDGFETSIFLSRR